MPDTIRDLVARLSLEQKVRLLTGADIFSTNVEPAIGLRPIVFSDGPSGIRGRVWDERSPSLSLPSATALAATWDLGMVVRYAGAMAEEARRKGVHVVLGPTINLHRSPLGGRHFESYSEDPTLTGQLAAAFVRAIQSVGTGAAVKHYVANDFETDRFTVDVEVDDRTLRELYLAPFEAAVAADVWVVMSAYNSVNGTTMSESPLLTTPLRTDWHFDGLVVSDWTAVRSTAASANADQDLVMPGPAGPWGDQLVDAVRGGAVGESAIDTKAARLVRLASCVGALGQEAERGQVDAGQIGADGIATAREVAAAGTVLLRNTGELPWSAGGLGSIAVIGELASWPRTQGGGSATVVPTEVISPVDGLRAALPESTIRVHRGVPVHTGIHPLALTEMTDPVTGEPGLHVRFFADDGAELLAEHRRAAELVYLGTAPKGASVVELATT
ncbi:MAG: glycoside hydrolase family 3 protein, partial [Aldersonia sp.]|nr:glycoside hydrolase family 3 protein [Aldersonia sp.]